MSVMTVAIVWSAGCASANTGRCSRYAAPWTHGAAMGSAKRPFRSVQRLVDSLRPGQTGCLFPGTYQLNLRLNHGGRRDAPITLTSVKRPRARIVGRIYIPQGSNSVHLTELLLDGRNGAGLPSPSVDSAGDEFIHDDVTNDHTAICFELGADGNYGQAQDTIIARSRIHDCGVLPPTNHQHGIYVANSVGAQILGNLIDHNADRGIQLYWNAQRTTIAGNIVDHNGEGIIVSGESNSASSNNLIINNLITNSTVRADVESWWPNPSVKGTGYVVSSNCVYGGKRTIDMRNGGFVARDNLRLRPKYANPRVGNYSLRGPSRCAQLLAKSLALVSRATSGAV
jgi:hypothetical protein